jgi:hypothetical protein
MALNARPAATFACVIGIDQYDAGAQWKLNGPVADALRFAQWLRQRGVPDEQITLFLAPPEPHQHDQQPDVRAAVRSELLRYLLEEIPRQRGDLFIIYWGGHGVVSIDGERRLFYADTTNAFLVNLNFAELLTTLRSELYRGFRHQILFVDACANYIDRGFGQRNLPSETLERGAPRKDVWQFVYFATRLGERARNLEHEATGVFSRELLAALNQTPLEPWPPDLDQLRADLQRRFTELRASTGGLQQTPSYSWYQDWDGSQGTLQTTLAPAPEPGSSSRIDQPLKTALVKALARCDTLSTTQRRDQVLLQLRRPIADRVKRDPALLYDVEQIVSACLAYRGGLSELIEVIRAFEPGSDALNEVERVFASLHEQSTEGTTSPEDRSAPLVLPVTLERVTLPSKPDEKRPFPSRFPNPFMVGRRVSADRFYGRQSQRDFIKQRLGGYEASSFTLLGLRRNGKSSLLNYIEERPEEFFFPDQRYIIVPISFQDIRISTPDSIYEEMRRVISEDTGVNPWGIDQNSNSDAIQKGLKQLARDEIRLIVLIDEFQSISSYLHHFEGWGMDWRYKCDMGLLNLGISTTRPISEIYLDCGRSSPFENIMLYEYLGAFKPEEWHLLVQEGFAKTEQSVSAEELQLIDNLAGGLPYYTQLAASLLWQHGDPLLVRERFSLAAEPQFQNLWRNFNPDERRVLSAIAHERRRILTTDDAGLVEHLRRHGILRSNDQLFGEPFATFVRKQKP